MITHFFGDSFGFEDDDFTALRLTEVVSEPIHKQMVACADAEIHDFVALVINTVRLPSRARCQTLFAEIRWKPDRVRHVVYPKRLFNVENQKPLWWIDSVNDTIRFGDNMNIRDTFKPLLDALPAGRNFGIRIANQILRRNTVKRRLHRAGWNLERLQEKRANAHRRRYCYEQHLDVLAPHGIGIRLEPFVGGKFKLLRLNPDFTLVRALLNRRSWQSSPRQSPVAKADRVARTSSGGRVCASCKPREPFLKKTSEKS